MKDLFLEPPIMLAVFVFCIVYFVIIFKTTKNKKIFSIFEIITISIFLFIVSGANVFPLDRLDPGDIGDPSKGFFSGLFLLIIYGLFFIVFRGKSKQIFVNFVLLFQQPWLGTYLGVLAFSVFWSENPIVTLKATVGVIFFSIFAVYLAKRYNWQELAKLLRWNSIFIALYSIFTALFVPSIGVCRKGWCGGFGHPIDLGSIMALGIAFWLLHAFSKPKYYLRSLICITICFIVMQSTNSAGSLVVFMTLIILLFFTTLLKRLNFTQAFCFFILLLFLFGVGSIWLLENFDKFLFFFNKDITISGRIPLWTLLLQTSIPERLWFGYGYNAFWQRWLGNYSPASDVVNAIIGNGRDWVAHAHNGFLDIALNIGLIGLLIFTGLFLSNVVRTIRLIISNKRSDSFLPLLILTFTFITNLFNSPIIIPSFNWFLFVIVTIRLNRFGNKRSGKTTKIHSVINSS